MDKNKALDKIKKCLALSKSPNANEAATALRQAQALMAKFNLSEADVELQGYGEATVDVPIQANKKKMPVVLNRLVGLMEQAFGVKPVLGRRVGISDVSYQVRYYGPKHRIQMTEYAHVVVYRAMEGAWRDHLKERPNLRGMRDARTSFQMGWLEEVSEKVMECGFTDDELESTKQLMATRYGKELAPATVNQTSLYGSLMSAGSQAAKDFNLSRPMRAEQGRLEKL